MRLSQLSYILSHPGDDAEAGLYCPTDSGSPNMTFSQQEGWLNYYEVLQLWYNETSEDKKIYKGECKADNDQAKPK